MATNKDLKWQITEQDHPEWVKFLDSNGNLVSSISGEGDTQLNVVINEIIGDSSATTGTVTVTCISCKPQKQQNISVCRCVCNCDRISIVWSTDTIGSGELPSGTQIGTYTINGACTESNINARIKKNGASGQGTTLNFSGGKITTTRKIAANTSSNPIQYDINVNVNDTDNCTSLSHQITQEGITCDCEKVLNSVTFNDIPQAGFANGAQVGSYMLNTNYQCPTDALSATLSDDRVTHVLVLSDNKIKLKNNDSISANGESGGKTFSYAVTYGANECSTGTKTQPGTGCGCDTIIVNGSLSISIPREEITGGTQLGQYTKQSQLCSDSDITGTLKYGSTIYNLTFSNNKVYLKDNQTIPENSDTEGREFAFKLYYKNSECTAFDTTITQPGTGCACGKLTGANFMEIPTTGVSAQTVIGSFSVEGDCDSHFTFSSDTLSLSSNSLTNEIITTADIGATSEPTGRTFDVEALFDGAECRSFIVAQGGANCACRTSNLDVDYLSVLTDGIPQTGLTSGTRVLTYTMNNSCPSNKIKITLSYPGSTQELTLRNGSGYLSSAIDEAGGQRRITVNVYYDDDECTSLRGDFTQEGLSCSCESFIAPESDWAVLPYGGTIHQEDKWVVVATGDTGIYTSTGTLAGICGSLSGRSDDNYLVEDETTGEKIKTAVLPPTAEEAAAGYTQGHIYEFSACVNDIHVLDPSASGRRRVIIEFWYTPYESGGESCKGQTGFWIDDNVCDCNNTPDLIYSEISCEGTNGEIVELGRIGSSNISTGLKMTAELVGVNPVINNFSYETDYRGNFIVKGSVPANEGAERNIGYVKINYTCQFGTPYQWNCNYKPFPFIQAQCETCTCDDESLLNLTIPSEIEFLKTKTSGSTFVASIPSKNCIGLYIENQDEETGIYDGGWFKAHIQKGNAYYSLIYELVGTEHANREATLNIKTRYRVNSSSDWVDCNTYPIIIRDSACYCSAVTRSMECFMESHPNGLTVNIQKGSRDGHSENIPFYDGYDENCETGSAKAMMDCVRLCVVDGNNNITGCTKDEKYVDPNGYFVAYGESGTWYYMSRIAVSALTDFDTDKDISVVPAVLSSTGEWIRCTEETYNVHITQEGCTCDEFKDKVHITADTFVYTESYSSPVRIRRAQLYTGCGNGELYVKGADGQYYNIGAKDDPNFPDYITNMTSGCNSSYLNWIEVYVKSLTEEGQTRSTDFAIYRCTSDGVDEDCYVDFTINEEFVTDCSKKSCTNDYTLELTWVCGSSAQNPCTIPYTGNIGNPMKIGEYNTPTGDCFTVEVDPHNPMVQNIDLRDNGSGRTEIYIECNANQATGPSSISIDINVYHIYEQNGETVKETCSNQYKTIAVTVEAPPTE